MATTLLLIDDDASLGESLRFMLTKKGFRVEIAYDAITGLQKAYALKPDAIILDVMLPDMDGLQVCRRFREMSDVPIMMLTALGAEQNIIDGLDRGADDYVVKPVTAGELSARIRALLRRSSRSTTPSAGSAREPIFSHDNLMIDFDKHEVTVDGKRVDLSPTEFRLLSVMARHKGRVLPHEFLLTEVWGPEYVGEVDYLRLYVSYLRRKIEKNREEPEGFFVASLLRMTCAVVVLTIDPAADCALRSRRAFRTPGGHRIVRLFC